MIWLNRWGSFKDYVIPLVILLTLNSAIFSYPTDKFTQTGRLRRSDSSGKPVYFFLKLWSPPLLHYHELASNPPRQPTNRKLSPYAFYHAYGKRSRGCEQEKSQKRGGTERIRSRRDPEEKSERSSDYDSVEVADW